MVMLTDRASSSTYTAGGSGAGVRGRQWQGWSQELSERQYIPLGKSSSSRWMWPREQSTEGDTGRLSLLLLISSFSRYWAPCNIDPVQTTAVGGAAVGGAAVLQAP